MIGFINQLKVKPCVSSRGRGIKVHNDLAEMIKYIKVNSTLIWRFRFKKVETRSSTQNRHEIGLDRFDSFFRLGDQANKSFTLFQSIFYDSYFELILSIFWHHEILMENYLCWLLMTSFRWKWQISFFCHRQYILMNLSAGHQFSQTIWTASELCNRNEQLSSKK